VTGVAVFPKDGEMIIKEPEDLKQVRDKINEYTTRVEGLKRGE